MGGAGVESADRVASRAIPAQFWRLCHEVRLREQTNRPIIM